MNFDQTQFVRTAKRLAAAEGYLELRMPRQALDALQGIVEPGPLRPAVEFLRGKALWLEHRYDDAARSLSFAAKNMRTPFDRPAWLALSMYYRQHGQQAAALDSFAQARGATLPETSPEPKIIN